MSIIRFYDQKGKERWFGDLRVRVYKWRLQKGKEGCVSVFGAVVGVEGKIYINMEKISLFSKGIGHEEKGVGKRKAFERTS